MRSKNVEPAKTPARLTYNTVLKNSSFKFIEQSVSVSLLVDPVDTSHRPITVIASKKLRDELDNKCIEQALNAAAAPGVKQLVINPDAHGGYGAPIGSVLVSPTHIYPGPTGLDIKCSMSLLQLDLPVEELKNKTLVRELIGLISSTIPSMVNRRSLSPICKKYGIDAKLADKIVTSGANYEICKSLSIPFEWTKRCEDSIHTGHDNTATSLQSRLADLKNSWFKNYKSKMGQFGTYGSGNHFGEANSVKIANTRKAITAAKVFGLKDDNIAFLSHCGSRGFGHDLAQNQFKVLLEKFRLWSIPLPGNDKELVYAPEGTIEANNYLDDMALAANFATVNHLLINSEILKCFQELIPGTTGSLVYFISHNIVRKEIINDQPLWIHRKGATRAWPANHPELENTPFFTTGHPILLPGNPVSGSKVMVAAENAKLSYYSINHGAGRKMGRNEAKRKLSQKEVDKELASAGILTNHRNYPVDEAPDVYKDFNEVIRSVEQAGLAATVADLNAVFTIKGK